MSSRSKSLSVLAIGVVALGALAWAAFGGRGHFGRLAANTAAVAAPELEGGVAWLNTAGPVKLKDLRGKIVVLDFWTLCCINCIHITARPRPSWRSKYPNELVVIGVPLSEVREREGHQESIRKAVLRYEIAHPVVNDAEITPSGARLRR